MCVCGREKQREREIERKRESVCVREREGVWEIERWYRVRECAWTKVAPSLSVMRLRFVV